MMFNVFVLCVLWSEGNLRNKNPPLGFLPPIRKHDTDRRASTRVFDPFFPRQNPIDIKKVTAILRLCLKICKHQERAL